jgi:hypothetical protein
MENMVSKAAAVKVIEDQIEWYTDQLNKQAQDLHLMEQRFRYNDQRGIDDSITLDGLILYKQDYTTRRARQIAVLSELLDVKGALERL